MGMVSQLIVPSPISSMRATIKPKAPSSPSMT
jgi:hypothetical protein